MMNAVHMRKQPELGHKPLIILMKKSQKTLKAKVRAFEIWYSIGLTNVNCELTFDQNDELYFQKLPF